MKRWKDQDGDETIGVSVGEMTVFATEQMSGRWALNFALTSELRGGDWMETLTGKGAFRTIRELSSAIKSVIAEIESLGHEWMVCCDSRRAKLYSRYISPSKIKITT
jgi:hypothetical protein